MVGVIVDDRASVDLADLAEAALDAVEPSEAFADLVVGDPELQRDGDRGERILDIVPPGHRHSDAFDRPLLAVAAGNDRVELAAARPATVTLSARRSASAEKP